MKNKSRKELLYEEAAHLFMEKSYPATSIRELAERIGIEPSSIYSHINSKEDLLIKICMDAADYFSSGIDKIIASEGTVREKIDRLIDMHIDAVFDLPTSVTVFNDEWKHLPDDIKNKFLEIRNSYQLKWINLLRQGIANHSVKNMDPFLVKEMILSGLRWIHYLDDEVKENKLEQMRSGIKRFLAEGYNSSN